jgi:DNA-binding transcriptional LysR family regulator
MELRQLEYFVAVAEEANFTRAAERVNVAQPGVSAQIRQLERELGQPLLDRTTRSVRLTEAGSAVLPYARAVLASAQNARQAVDELLGLVRGRVSIGMVVACAAVDLFEVLADFHRAHPAIELSLTEASSEDLLDGLLEGELDLAWIGRAGAAPEGVETHTLIDEALVAAVPVPDRTFSRDRVTLQQLCGNRLLSLPRGTGVRQALEQACAAEGLQARVTLEANSPATVASLASKGLGVAVLPQSVVSAIPDLRSIAIVEPGLRSRVELAWRAGGPHTPAARALQARALEVLRGQPT